MRREVCEERGERCGVGGRGVFWSPKKRLEERISSEARRVEDCRWILPEERSGVCEDSPTLTERGRWKSGLGASDVAREVREESDLEDADLLVCLMMWE